MTILSANSTHYYPFIVANAIVKPFSLAHTGHVCIVQHKIIPNDDVSSMLYIYVYIYICAQIEWMHIYARMHNICPQRCQHYLLMAPYVRSHAFGICYGGGKWNFTGLRHGNGTDSHRQEPKSKKQTKNAELIFIHRICFHLHQRRTGISGYWF